MKDNSEFLSKIVKGAYYDTILQVSLRLFSFFINAIIIKSVSSEKFAVMFVRLYLLYSTGLLLSRESFRRAAFSMKVKSDVERIVNVIWIGTFLSALIGSVQWLIWCYGMERPPIDLVENYELCAGLIAVSVTVDVMAEVPFILAELQMWIKTKVVIEGLMQLLRQVLTATLVVLYPERAVFLFCIAHLLGSFLFTLSYFILFYVSLKNQHSKKTMLVERFSQLFPVISFTEIKEIFDANMLSLSFSFFKQGWIKEALTEGELYVMNFMPAISLASQGVYQIISNIGSLPARLIFKNIEASAYKFFAQMVERDKQMSACSEEKIIQVSGFFFQLLRYTTLISLILLLFGYSYSQLFLQIYGGTKLVAGLYLMRLQLFMLLFLGANGITEAFTFAAMSRDELARYNKRLLKFSVAYIVSCIPLTYIFGVAGFVFANCLNMSLRIYSSVLFIAHKYEGLSVNPLDGLFIPLRLVAHFVIIWIVTTLSEVFFYTNYIVLHLTMGTVCFLYLLYALRWELKGLYVLALSGVAQGMSLVPLFNSSKPCSSYADNALTSTLFSILYESTEDVLKKRI